MRKLKSMPENAKVIFCITHAINEGAYEVDGVEDWEVGDGASAIMCDNGTQEIFDDSIVSVRYNSWNLLGE